MEISHNDVLNRHKRVSLKDAQETSSLKRTDWLPGISLVTKETGKFVGKQSGLRDPKAVKMLEYYASPNINLGFGNWHAYLVLWYWQVYNGFQKQVKRAFDLLIVLCVLPFLLPVILLTAVVIKLDSPGPIFFGQKRVGKWGRGFTCYKFRSMYKDAEARKAELMALNEADEVIFKIKNDPRVTRVGGIIRKLSIDELPQILNVIKGDMSIVGPRPPVPCEVVKYTFDTFRRLDAVPGITGLQQVSGRSDLSFRRWVELDIEYIQNQSLKKDIEILLRTIPTVLSGKGAY